MEWRVIVRCPVHRKEVILMVSAPDAEMAKETALGMTVACFPPYTKVLSPDGLKNILHIKHNDLIWGKKCFAEVQDTMSRRFSGDLIAVNPTYFNEVRMTPEHPVFIGKKRWPTAGFNFTPIDFEWKKAENLEPREYLVLPNLQESRDTHYWGVKLDLKHVRLFGWYLSEGWANDRSGESRVEFSLGKHEEDYVNELCNLIREFGHKPFTHTGESITRVYFASAFYSKRLKRLLGHGAKHKHLPENFLLWKPHLIEELLSTLVRGDGHIREARRVYRHLKGDQYHSERHRYIEYSKETFFSTRSEILAQQVQLLCWKVGKIAGLQKSFRRSKHINGRRLPAGVDHVVYWTDSEIHHAHKLDGHWLIPIRQVRKVPYSGYVYNLQTADHTINVPFITHNCPWGPIDIEAHTFEVTEENWIAVSEPWKPPATLVGPTRQPGVIVSVVPPPEVPPVPVRPPREEVYVMSTDQAEEMTKTLTWWEYAPLIERVERKRREMLERATREAEEERLREEAEFKERLRRLEEERLPKAEEERRRIELLEKYKGRKRERLLKVWERAEIPKIGVIPKDEWEKIKKMFKRIRGEA